MAIKDKIKIKGCKDGVLVPVGVDEIEVGVDVWDFVCFSSVETVFKFVKLKVAANEGKDGKV